MPPKRARCECHVEKSKLQVINEILPILYIIIMEPALYMTCKMLSGKKINPSEARSIVQKNIPETIYNLFAKLRLTLPSPYYKIAEIISANQGSKALLPLDKRYNFKLVKCPPLPFLLAGPPPLRRSDTTVHDVKFSDIEHKNCEHFMVHV